MYPRCRHVPSGSSLQPRAHPPLGVVDDVLHACEDGLGSELVERVEKPASDRLDGRDLRSQVEGEEVGKP